MIGSSGFNSSSATDPYAEKIRAIRLDHARRRGREIEPDGSKGPEPAGELHSVTPFVPRRIQLINSVVPGPPAGIKIPDPLHPHFSAGNDSESTPDIAETPTVEESDNLIPDSELDGLEILLDAAGVEGDAIDDFMHAMNAEAGDGADPDGSVAISLDQLKELFNTLGHDTSDISDIESLKDFFRGLIVESHDSDFIPTDVAPTADPHESPDEVDDGDLIPNEDPVDEVTPTTTGDLIPTDVGSSDEVGDEAVSQTVEESLGEGHAKAVADGTGMSIAQTGAGSVGNADSRSFGEGDAISIVGDDSQGKSFASSGGEGDTLAQTGAGSKGNATATSTGSGAVLAMTGDESEGSVSARANADGSVQAISGMNSKGDASASSMSSGSASAVTGKDSLGKAISVSEGSADATATTGDGSAGDATASSASDGFANAATGFNSGGDSTAISRGAGAALAIGGANSTGLTRAEAHKEGSAAAVGGDQSRGQAIAEALGAGNSSAGVQDMSTGNAVAKSKLGGDSVAEVGESGKGNAHAIANSEGSATAGTGNGSTGHATATTDGAGDASAVTGDGSTGDATAIANQRGGSVSAIVTNGSAGDANAHSRGSGSAFAVADGKGSVTAIAERDGGILAVNSSDRPMVVQNRSSKDVEVLNLSEKSVSVEIRTAGTAQISVPGFGSRTFHGNSFTILPEGSVVAREVDKPVPSEVTGELPQISPPDVNFGPLELTSISNSGDEEDSVALRSGFNLDSPEDTGTVDDTPVVLEFSGSEPRPVDPESFIQNGIPENGFVSLVTKDVTSSSFGVDA